MLSKPAQSPSIQGNLRLTRFVSPNGWLDPQRRQFNPEQIAAVREVSPGSLEELTDLQCAHAEIYRATPLTDAPGILQRIRKSLDTSSFADNPTAPPP